MEGMSEILAVILIIVIVVALVGLTYTFASVLFKTTITATTTTATAVTVNMMKTIDIIAVNCYNTSTANYYINFTLRDSGQQVISNQMGAFLDGVTDISSTSTVPTAAISVANDTLNPNQVRGYSYTGTQSTHAVGTRTLTITTAMPAETVSTTLSNCPA